MEKTADAHDQMALEIQGVNMQNAKTNRLRYLSLTLPSARFFYRYAEAA